MSEEKKQRVKEYKKIIARLISLKIRINKIVFNYDFNSACYYLVLHIIVS